MESGSLADVMKRFQSKGFSEELTTFYTRQVLHGLVYLHEQGVIHRDIKAANILTNKIGEVKLADFGVATTVTLAENSKGDLVGSPYWMAPEIVVGFGSTTAGDIW